MFVAPAAGDSEAPTGESGPFESYYAAPRNAGPGLPELAAMETDGRRPCGHRPRAPKAQRGALHEHAQAGNGDRRDAAAGTAGLPALASCHALPGGWGAVGRFRRSVGSGAQGIAASPDRVREAVEERLGVLPTEAGVGDALPVYPRLARLDILAARDEVALDHDPDDARVAGRDLGRHLLADQELALVLLGAVAWLKSIMMRAGRPAASSSAPVFATSSAP